MIAGEILDLFLKLEGPYKWYAIGAVLVVLTALVTRFIFRTFKWFLIIAAIGVLIISALTYLSSIAL
jgi:hypothetical protein